MSKRKKTQISENQELSISKAKKTYKRKSQSTRDCDLEKPAEASDSSNTLSKATVAEAVQECKEQGLDNQETGILPTDLGVSLAEEREEASSERKGHAQGEKLVPVFAKTKNKVPGRREGNNADAPAVQTKQDVLESSEAECMVRNAPCDIAEKAFHSTAAPSEPLELMDLSVANEEDIGGQGIQNQDRVIISMNNGDAVPGFIDSQLEEAQKETDIPENISEKQKMKSKKRVSFFLCTSDNKDAESPKEGELSTESLKSHQNEEAQGGPSLQTERGTKNRCEALVPIIKQSKFGNCELRPNEIGETSSKGDADQRMDGKEKTEICGENKLVCVEGCVSSAENISQLDGAVARSESSRENLGSEAQGSLLSRESGTSTLSSLVPVTHMFSAVKDPLSVDLDFLLDSQLQGVFESNSLEHPPRETFSLEVPCVTAGGTKSTANVAHPKNARDEMTARICDPPKGEDATNIVCGLIKELSNLNRLVMSTHRHLDSFKRQKFWRYRQSGKLLPHSMNTTANMRCTVKKKKKISLANAIASCNICKGFLRSSDVMSKAAVTHNVEADV